MRRFLAGKMRNALRKSGFELRRVVTSATTEANGAVVSLKPSKRVRGRVLMSYVIDPFLRKMDQRAFDSHTHYWESCAIAESFRDRGFIVDVVSYRNAEFVPADSYDFFIGARTNLQRIGLKLNQDCIKIAHLDTANWLFNNHAAYSRLLELQNRRGITLDNPKMVEPNWAIESADMGTVLGNEFTMQSYRFARKPIHRIPISAPREYDWPVGKDLESCRRHFLWFGSRGFVHKGLDVVLEAFAGLPDHHLTVCGPIDSERQFQDAFRTELYHTPNIHTYGWIDVTSPTFVEVARRCLGVVYPSCSEGGGGSVITCMHAGLIPIVTEAASVDIGSSGVTLRNHGVDHIRSEIVRLSMLPASDLEDMARTAWESARRLHTRESFAASLSSFLDVQLSIGN